MNQQIPVVLVVLLRLWIQSLHRDSVILSRCFQKLIKATCMQCNHIIAVCATYPALKCGEKADAPLPHLTMAEIFSVLANDVYN